MFEPLIKQYCYILFTVFVLLSTEYTVYSQNKDIDSTFLSLDFMNQVLERNPNKSFYEYQVEDWNKLVRDYPFDQTGLPDLAWKTRSTLEALFFLYLMTSDDRYANLHIQLTDDLLNTRDDKRKIKAWNGKINKFWSSGNRYNYGYFEIKNSKGKVIGLLEFKDAKVDECYVSITQSKTDSFNFDLVINNHRNKIIYSVENTNPLKLEEDIKIINWTSYISDNEQNKVLNFVPNNKLKTKGKVKTIAKKRINSYYVPSIDVNAIHLNSLINSYSILKNRNDFKKIKIYRKYIESTIKANTLLYIKEDKNKCYFQYPINSKTVMGGGVVYPYNKQFSYVAMLSKWYKITGDKRLYELIKKWKNYFLTQVEETDYGLIWKYWDDPSNTIVRYETENYGSHDIKYLITIFENCDVFSEKDINRITRSIRENLILCNQNLVYTKTAFDFKWKAEKLPNINYLSLGNFWEELFDCYYKHVKIQDLHWTDRVALIYYFKKRNE